MPFRGIYFANLIESGSGEGVSGSLNGSPSPVSLVGGCKTSKMHMKVLLYTPTNASVVFSRRRYLRKQGFMGGL